MRAVYFNVCMCACLQCARSNLQSLLSLSLHLKVAQGVKNQKTKKLSKDIKELDGQIAKIRDDRVSTLRTRLVFTFQSLG